jgi:hypothetical protein
MVKLRSGITTFNTTTVLREKSMQNPFTHYKQHHKEAYDKVFAALLSVRRNLIPNLQDLASTLSNVYIQIDDLPPFSLSQREVGALVHAVEHPDTLGNVSGYMLYYRPMGGPSQDILLLLQKVKITVMNDTPPPTPLVPDVEASRPLSPPWLWRGPQSPWRGPQCPWSGQSPSWREEASGPQSPSCWFSPSMGQEASGRLSPWMGPAEDIPMQ